MQLRPAFFIATLLLLTSCSSGDNEPRKHTLVQGETALSISSRSERIGQTWCEGSVHNQPLVERYYTLLKAQNDHFVVLDIGAQTGGFSLLAKYFPNSTWHAFEPLNEVANELKTNLKMNDIEGVSVHEIALSNTSGVGNLVLPRNSSVLRRKNFWGSATLAEKPRKAKKYHVRQVELSTLDDFISKNGIQKVDIVRVDTEGWEKYVLEGGQKLLEQHKPILFVKANPQKMKHCLVDKKAFFHLLKGLGYKWEFLSPEDLVCIHHSSSFVHYVEPILFVPIEKTASVYIENKLAKGLGKDICSVTNKDWPMYDIIPGAMPEFVETGAIAREHLLPTPDNIAQIKKYNLKVIFHTRDLRQRVVSHAHFHHNMVETNPYGVTSYFEAFRAIGYDVAPKSLDDLSSWTLDDFIEAHIGLVDETVDRIKGWLKVNEEGKIPMLFTSFEEFKDDPDEFFSKILSFLSIDEGLFHDYKFAKEKDVHFRRGAKKEYLETLSPEKLERINQKIPEEFFTIFGWDH